MESRLKVVGMLIILVLIVSTEAWAGCCTPPPPTINTSVSRSFFPIGRTGVDNQLTQVQADEKPFNATLRLGALYDSRVGTVSGTDTSDDADFASVFRIGAGYRFSLEGPVELRMDYSGYSQFYKDRDEFNVLDQSISLNPIYRFNQSVISFPASFRYIIEDGKKDSYLYTLLPTYTWLIPDTSQALAFYAILSAIEDQDGNPDLDEDGRVLGGGCSYIYLMDTLGQFRLSIDYTTTTYDASVLDYGSTSQSSDNRKDRVFTAGLDCQYQINKTVGLYANYSFIHSESNVDLNDYNRNIVELGITFNY